VIREIMLFLHAQGVGTSRAVRIFKTYGQDAVQVISDNPYGSVKNLGQPACSWRADRPG